MPGIGSELDLLKWILGAMFTLILASFAYTHRGLSALWRRLTSLEENHLHIMNDRLVTLEQRVKRIESGPGPESE